MLTTMHGLVKDVMYVSQGNMLMYGEDAAYHYICAWCMILPHGMINQ